MQRADRLLSQIDVRTELGVELGALDKPVVPRTAGRILYADHVSTEELRRKYAEHGRQGLVDLGALVPVDVVLGDAGLRRALGERAPVDYVVASHVLEHVADPIGWLLEVSEALTDGGRLALAMPDKRFTFDHFRQPTALRELLDLHLGRVRIPTPGQVFDHVANAAVVDPALIWSGGVRPRVPLEGHNPVRALKLAREVATSRAYHDVHCTVYTPFSFCEALRQLTELGILPFELVACEPTTRGEIEFFITLRNRPGGTAEGRASTYPRLNPAEHDELPGAAPVLRSRPPPRSARVAGTVLEWARAATHRLRLR